MHLTITAASVRVALLIGGAGAAPAASSR